MGVNGNIRKNWGLMSEEQKNILRKSLGDQKFGDLERSIGNQNTTQNQQPTQSPQQDTNTPQNNFGNGGEPDYSNKNQYNSNQSNSNQDNYTLPKQEYGKDKQFDPQAQFDSSTFKDPNAQIKIQEGKAQQTGRPDYEIDTDARMQEITNNLNAYWNTNKELFRNRQTFNQAFDYHNRKSEAQRALLDSFWKRKEDSEKISNYSTPDSILKGLNDGELTKDQMDLIKEKNPELYKGYEQKIEEDTNLRIINKVVPNDTLNTVEAMQRIIEKANIQSTPYDIDKRFQENLEKYGVLRDSNRLREQQDRIEQEYSDRDSEEAKIRSQYAGSYSSAYISAKLSQVARRYTTRIQGMQQRYSAMLQGRNQNLALAQADTQALIQQTAEDQRVFNNTLKGFGFAMNIMSFETPEQQRQAQLYKEQTSKEIDLAYRSKLGDIELKQKRKSIEQQMEIQSELSDLNIKDPKKLRRNIYNELDPYYKKYGDIIMRSQQQVADDVITYAKKHGVSVGEALTQNFIQPLQSKKGYKNVVNAKYGLGEQVGQSKRRITTDANGKIKIEQTGTGDIPQDIKNMRTRAEKLKYLENVVAGTGGNIQEIAERLENIPDGVDMGQCGQFVNRVGIVIGDNPSFGDTLEDKKKKINSKTPEVGSFVVMNTGAKLDNGTLAGHVGIVTDIHNDGTITVKDSNWKNDEKTLTHKLSYAEMQTVEGYRKPKAKEVSNNISDADIYSFNDTTSRRKMSKEEVNRISEAKSRIMEDPNSSMKDILNYSKGGKNPTDSVSQPFLKYQQAIDQIGNLQKSLEGFDTGPLIGILKKNNPYDTKAQLIKAQLTSLVPNLARGVYGEVGVLTDTDIANYTKTLPNLKSTKEVSDALLGMTMKMLKNGYKDRLRNTAALGYDVSGMYGTYLSLQNKIEAIEGVDVKEEEELQKPQDSFGFDGGLAVPNQHNIDVGGYFNQYY